MNKQLYPMIFKRKSFHVFRNIGELKITDEELNDVLEAFKTFTPLVEGIKVELHAVKKSSLAIGQEYCLMLYSEVKNHYLQNIGYLGEQLDLYCVSKNIGTLWFGLGKTDQKQKNGLDYVIMIAIRKVDSETNFRKDMYQSKRKSLNQIWRGESYQTIGDIVRFAPSAVNSQPWLVEATENELKVYRVKTKMAIGNIFGGKMDFYNQIDIGIFLCFLELSLRHNGICFSKNICLENEAGLNAIYEIKRNEE